MQYEIYYTSSQTIKTKDLEKARHCHNIGMKVDPNPYAREYTEEERAFNREHYRKANDVSGTN